jgi:hypothetical protein
LESLIAELENRRHPIAYVRDEDASQLLVAATKLAAANPVSGGNHADRNSDFCFQFGPARRVIDGDGHVTGSDLAFSTVPGGWRLKTTAARNSNGSTSPPEHLLPLPNAKRVVGRWSDSHELLLEIVSVRISRKQLLRTWREKGWEINQTAVRVGLPFSCLCAKDDEFVYAWSTDVADELSSVALVRTL